MKHVFLSGIRAGYYWLEELIKEKANIEAILTKRDNKACDSVDFSVIAEKFGIPFYEIKNINNEKNISILKNIQPDVLWVLGWSQILKENVLDTPAVGCIGSHPTKLPRYRGRAPIPWTIIKGLKESALTFFWLDKGTDTGDILAQKEFSVDFEDTATTLYEKMIEKGKEIIKEYLPLIESGNPPRIKQNEKEFIESWPKRTPEDSLIDWNKGAVEVYNLIRATTHPYPGAFTYQNGDKLIIWGAKFSNKDYKRVRILEEIFEDSFSIGCKNGSVLVKRLQKENDIEMNTKDFLRKYNFGEGFIFGKK